MVCLFVCFRERQGRGFSLVSQGWMFGKKDYVQHVFTVCVCVCALQRVVRASVGG